MQILKSIMIATVVFLLMDSLWIGVIAKQLYISQLGPFLKTPNFLAAGIVYVALITGILIFVIPKAHGNPVLALLWGALFGLITYAIYDFTNLAIVKNWPIAMSLIDIVWGCVVCGITSCITTWFQ